MTHHLLKAVLFASLGVTTASLARASTNYFGFDSNPYLAGLCTVYSGGDNGTLATLAGSWISDNGSPLEAGVVDQSTNGYWAITQTTPTNTYSAHGMHSEMVTQRT